MKILLVEAYLKSFNRLKDGAVTLSFESLGEMDKESFALVDDYYRQKGHLAFKLDAITLADMPTENTSVKGQRSRSQLLRNKLLALHFKKGGSRDDFQPFYEKWMDAFDQSVQRQLDELGD